MGRETYAAVAKKTFSQFILEEMNKRGMSQREFADMVGVTHRTIGRFIETEPSEETGYPSVDVLIKLSKALNWDICALIALVAPESVLPPEARTDAMVLSQRIEQLPDNIREAIDALLARYAPE